MQSVPVEVGSPEGGQGTGTGTGLTRLGARKLAQGSRKEGRSCNGTAATPGAAGTDQPWGLRVGRAAARCIDAIESHDEYVDSNNACQYDSVANLTFPGTGEGAARRAKCVAVAGK